MAISRKTKMLLALPACLAGYLAIVACWAYATFDEVLARVHTQPDARLTAKQTEILRKVEDSTFFHHNGLSIGNGQGCGTISSAVARDVYLSGADLEGTACVLQTLYRGVFSCCKKLTSAADPRVTASC